MIDTADQPSTVKALDKDHLEVEERGAALEQAESVVYSVAHAILKQEGGETWWVLSTEEQDRSGDIVRVAGWELKNFQKNPQVLWMHDMWSPPIGNARQMVKNRQAKRLEMLVEWADAINPFAALIKGLVEGKFVHAASPRFKPIRVVIPKSEDERARMGVGMHGVEFQKQELLEGSIVTVPDNPTALRRCVAELAVEGQIDAARLEELDRYQERHEGARELVGAVAKAWDECRLIYVQPTASQPVPAPEVTEPEQPAPPDPALSKTLVRLQEMNARETSIEIPETGDSKPMYSEAMLEDVRATVDKALRRD